MSDDPTSDNLNPDPVDSPQNGGSFWAELKRRKVIRVAITYAVVAWVVM